jgi:carboxypeptidase Taq
MPSPLDELKDRLGRIADLNNAAAVLEWDQETFMPPGGAEARAHQLSTLRTLSHELFTADETRTLLDRLADEDDEQSRDLVRVTRRDFEQATKLPAELVSAFASTTALAKEAWKTARETDDFSLFQPHLQQIIELNVRKAEALGYQDRLYDALIDEYEPGTTTADIERSFRELRASLVPMVRDIASQPQPETGFLRQHVSREVQWSFGLEVIRAFGYDFERGRQDVSAHPFSTTFSIGDTRITTRIQEDYFPTGFFGTLHEAGHAMYEQGIDPAFERTPLASGTSLGMHESQSRMWENMVGRSRGFWEFWYPRLQSMVGGESAWPGLHAFHLALNRVEPSLIRVEADEVTYNLHVMLRFELELELLEGRLAVADLPQYWNARMEEYLGVVPPNDADGALQDIHWSLGAFGYFPTYTLGNLMSAQLFEAASRDLGDLEAMFEAGQYAPLLGWLRENVHRHGRARTATQILHDVTGGGLDAGPWLAYVRRKYGGQV